MREKRVRSNFYGFGLRTRSQWWRWGGNPGGTSYLLNLTGACLWHTPWRSSGRRWEGEACRDLDVKDRKGDIWSHSWSGCLGHVCAGEEERVKARVLGTLQILGGSLGWGVGWWKVLVTEERLLQVENQKIMIIKAKARVCLLLIRRMWSAAFLPRSQTDSQPWLQGITSISRAARVTDQFGVVPHFTHLPQCFCRVPVQTEALEANACSKLRIRCINSCCKKENSFFPALST